MDWVTVAKAVEVTGYSDGYIRHLVAYGRIPAKFEEIKVSRRVVSLDSLLDHKRIAKTGRPPKNKWLDLTF